MSTILDSRLRGNDIGTPGMTTYIALSAYAFSRIDGIILIWLAI
ncbi:hypothetical protein [Candidatus Tisiphia endosymbiont of Hybos culiciformis]